MAEIKDNEGISRIQDLFLRQAKVSPNAIAISYQKYVWTYAEVEFRSRIISLSLIEQGLQKGDRVAILAERGPDLIWTLLGVLRAGAAFVIMDSNYPPKRLADLISIGAPQMLVVAGGEALHKTASTLSQTAAVALFVGPAYIGTQETISDFDCDPLTDIAYIIFTSGTTGMPKAVACNHIALIHFILWHAAHFDMTARDRFSMLSGLSHDPLLRDIFTPLSIGATLVIPQQSLITEPGRLRQWMHDSAVSIVHLTPPMGQLLSAGGRSLPELPALRKMFWGGDQLLSSLLSAVSQFAPSAEHINFYGCSETPQAILFCRFELNFNIKTVPIGMPVPGFEITIVNSAKQSAPNGEIGELAVHSKFLSLGYLRDGLVAGPNVDCADSIVEPVYYTGDKGYRLPDGNIVMIGRADDQIKIRGYRVDLSEVSYALHSLQKVTMAVALPVKNSDSVWIDAFVAYTSEVRPDEKELSVELAQMLPSYMLPKKIWLFQDKLPTLANGKVDRAALQELSATQQLHGTEKGDIDSTEMSEKSKALKERWQEIFPSATMSTSMSFAQLGGDSLSYVEAYLAAEEVIGTLPIDWQQKSIEELTALPIRKSRFLVSIDSFMLFRAVAIVLILAYHFKLSKLGDGETGALFLVSGFLFGGMQLREIFNGGRVERILVSVKNLFWPTAFFTILASCASFWQGETPPLRLFLFGTDLVDYHNLIVRGVPVFRHIIVFWYIHALIQMLFMMYLLIRILPSRYKSPDKLFGLSIAWFLLCVVAKFCLPIIFQWHFLSNGAPELSLAQISPIGNFATFALGILLANAISDTQKVTLGVSALLYSGFNGLFYGWANALPVLIAVIVILLMPRIRLPRIIASVAFSLSGSSLFIYLGHLLIGFAAARAFGAPPMAQCLVALAVGVGLHSLWDKSGRVIRHLSKEILTYIRKKTRKVVSADEYL
jgi:amino acid adenylation domain-containing protein